MSPTNTLVPVIDLPFLASEVNDAHRQVTFHAKSMLLEAKRAGEALLEAKRQVKHGEFKAWVEGNCRCSYKQACKYLQVARICIAKVLPQENFEMGINAFLEVHSTPRPSKTVASCNQMDATDAEYILKLNAMAERASPNEAVIASRKLTEWVDKAFALSPEVAIAQAKALLPDNDKARGQAEREAADEKLSAAEKRLAEVEAKLAQMMNRKAELRSKLSGRTREELLELLVDAYLQLDPPV